MNPRRLPPVRDLAPMAPPVTVVGDVHLTPEAPATVRRFLGFLEQAAATGGTLVLLGDVFDWWVGRRQAEREPFARTILDALRAVVARGVKLAFLAGNRDYPFDGADGLEIDLWPDVVRTRWGDRTVVLSHGDLLCSADTAYLRMRRLLRSAPMRFGLRCLPYRAATYLARGLRDVSDRAAKRHPGALLGLDYGLARRWMEGYDADVLVVGHVHTGVHHRLAGEKLREIFVLKDWSGVANAVRFRDGHIALDAYGARAIPIT